MLPVQPPIAPMLAQLRRELPMGDWCYEPKWDGFRCLLFRDGDDVTLQSRNERPLDRYFPEVVAAARALPDEIVLDGELLLEERDDFPMLLSRIHPAASRVTMLATEHPATFVAFDCLVSGGRSLIETSFEQRRAELERLQLPPDDTVALTPLTADPATAQEWFDHPQPGWDGIVAKAATATYEPGRRTMVKVKQERTADCVVAGIRLSAAGVSSLLLGLWTWEGSLHHPGVVSSPPRAVKTDRDLVRLAVPLEEHPWRSGFGLEGGTTGRLKGAGSRWLPEMTLDWVPVAPVRVAEVSYDRLDGMRFRHPARFRHWRPDREPGSCRVDQLVVGR
jgi:ATP-dependent DNA ligase